jgi:hypothetical protein
MDTDELERRVADAHRACTIGDLTTVTADLPVPAAPPTSATRQLRSVEARERIVGFVTPSLVCIAIWLATGTGGSFWPRWVLLFIGIAFVVSMLKTVLDVNAPNDSDLCVVECSGHAIGRADGLTARPDRRLGNT